MSAGNGQVDLRSFTLPQLLVRNAERFGDRRVALREKEFGIWQEVTWAGYLRRVRDFSLGLVALGLARGGTVAIIGDNRPEWLYAELAAQAAGGVSVGVYQDSTLAEVVYVIGHCDATVVVAEDQEQVDKLLEVRAKTPGVRAIVYTDPRGLRHYRDDGLAAFEEIEALGRAHGAAHAGLFETNVAAGRPDDLAILCYTSGTTGLPKGSMLTHRNLLNMALRLMEVDPKYESDEFLSFLPLAWIGEQMMAASSSLAVGFTVNFPESPATVQADLREIGPHVMFSPPRIWENLAATVRVKAMDATWLKRRIFDWALPIGYAMADARFARRSIPAGLRIRYALAELACFRALKDRLGLSRIRSATTGGAALGPDTFRFFHGLGVNLKQIYGQTEIAGISCIHRDGEVRFDTVGRPIPGTEVRIGETGEILSRSDSVFNGYYKDPEATAETLRDGWLHSGDAGYFTEDGQLVVIDRVKDVMRLADGTTFSPQFIENKLKFSPYVKEAVVIGSGRPYLAAMINIDMGIVGKWAERRHISYTTYTDLAAKPEVYDLVEAEVRRVNESLPEAARLRKFVLLYKELDADDDELTRTRKIRRRFVEDRYAPVVEGLYGSGPEIPVEATIKYQDGRQATIRTRLAVREIRWPSS
ncbi:MAG TPA: long-chain fatty acid--CoA ligase [Thermodesulfobacteriota bacterium]